MKLVLYVVQHCERAVRLRRRSRAATPRLRHSAHVKAGRGRALADAAPPARPLVLSFINYLSLAFVYLGKHKRPRPRNATYDHDALSGLILYLMSLIH